MIQSKPVPKPVPKKKVLKYKEKKAYCQASDLRISTISAVSFLNADIDFLKLFQRLPLVSKTNPDTGVFSMKHYQKDIETQKIIRSIRHHDTEETLTQTEVKSYFQNQITIIWTFYSKTGELRTTNGFMFTNGKIKGVGLKSNEDIALSFESLRLYLQKHLVDLGDAVQIIDVPTESLTQTEDAQLCLYGTRATMFNTDFSTHFQIIRDELFRIIIEDYGLEESEFEPDIYPAVKIKYAWNTCYKNQDNCTPGVCYCKKRCNGKGCGEGDGQCKVVTICVFGNDAPNRHGGKIIITGANQYQQVLDVYTFINRILKTHYDKVVYLEPYMDYA